MSAPDPQALARQVGETMFVVDVASKDTMGMELLACEPGRALMRMVVKPLHLNGHQICHGGFIFTLADSTFAFACNSYNELTVASGFSIDIVAPSRLGDRLKAVAKEISLAGRTGVYDITITNQADELIAVFRGRSYRIKGKPVVALHGPSEQEAD